MTFNENLSEARLTGDNLENVFGDDPCLAYHDTERLNCALCKPGSARIFAIDSSTGNKFVLCGSVRSEARDTTGAYEFLNPDAVTSYDDYAN